jgi:hypothetical protein
VQLTARCPPRSSKLCPTTLGQLDGRLAVHRRLAEAASRRCLSSSTRDYQPLSKLVDDVPRQVRSLSSGDITLRCLDTSHLARPKGYRPQCAPGRIRTCVERIRSPSPDPLGHGGWLGFCPRSLPYILGQWARSESAARAIRKSEPTRGATARGALGTSKRPKSTTERMAAAERPARCSSASRRRRERCARPRGRSESSSPTGWPMPNRSVAPPRPSPATGLGSTSSRRPSARSRSLV